MSIYYYCQKCSGTFDPAHTQCPNCDAPDDRDAEIASLRASVERLTEERNEALRGFGIGPNEPAGLKRYAEVFTREIRECPTRTQDTEGAVCACVSVITAHVRRMLQERLDAKDEALSLREEREDYRKGVAELTSRAESAEATIERLAKVVRAARELRTNYEDLIIGEWGPFDGPFCDEFTKPFDAAISSLTAEDRRRVGIEG